MLLPGVAPPMYVPAMDIVFVTAYPVPPVTTSTVETSKLLSLVILNVAPDPPPLFVDGTLEYWVALPTLDPVVLVTGNNKLFAGVAPPRYVPAIPTVSPTM